jgi:hypothetical protein
MAPNKPSQNEASPSSSRKRTKISKAAAPNVVDVAQASAVIENNILVHCALLVSESQHD